MQELGRKRLGIAVFEVLFLDRDQLLYRFVLDGSSEMTWEGMGSRDRRDGVGRFGRGGHTPLGHWRNPGAQLQAVCRRTAKITSEQGLKALKNVRNFQPSSRQERRPSRCE